MNKITSMDRGCLAGILICVLGIILSIFLATSAVAKPRPNGWVRYSAEVLTRDLARIDSGQVAIKLIFVRDADGSAWTFGFAPHAMEVAMVVTPSEAVRILNGGELPRSGKVLLRKWQNGKVLRTPDGCEVASVPASQVYRILYGN